MIMIVLYKEEMRIGVVIVVLIKIGLVLFDLNFQMEYITEDHCMRLNV